MGDTQDITKPISGNHEVSVFSDCASALLIVKADSGQVLVANGAAGRVLQNCCEGASILDWLSMNHKEAVELLRKAVAAGHLDFRDHYAPLSMGRREFHLHGGPIEWAGRSAFLVMVRELMGPDTVGSPPRDSLKGLPNKALFRDRLDQALARARRADEHFAVLFIDLDRFATVEGGLGSDVADAVLREFAERWRSFVRATDTVARYGSDEFAVLMTGQQDGAHSAILAKKVLRSLATPFACNNRDVPATASIGVSLFHCDLTEAEDYLDRAEWALRGTKDEGRNTYRFHTETLDELFCSEVAIGTDLHHALEDKDLSIVYQPQIDHATNRIVGLEALARWEHPRRGQVPPYEFIGVAERTNQIIPLGNWGSI